MDKRLLYTGIDVGSTTTKIAAADPGNNQIVYSEYKRHHAKQVSSVYRALKRLEEKFPDAILCPVFTGSGGKQLADGLGLPFIQEVVAGSAALKTMYKNVGTAIELGGQDAKIVFFGRDEATGQIRVSDMRMNGSCAGGTGAFIDEIASVLRVPVEEFNDLAAKGTCVYDISGRCGVYAKTDIQPLLNQGIAKENLALSAFHAIAKQTIGGLAQGLEIGKPVAFEGGPLTFNPVLIRVFAERLGLSEDEILVPDHPELMIARGAALSLKTMEGQKERNVSQLLKALEAMEETKKETSSSKGKAFFADAGEQEEFLTVHGQSQKKENALAPGEKVKAYLGIDSGSTTTKFVLMDEEEEILDTFYSSNEGDPLRVAKEALITVRDRYQKAGANLEILAVGTTGYGEQLFAKAFSADCHVVETVAHGRAAEKYVPGADFILDIGGQDMKAIWLDHGIITNIVVNEACSSGCGSFLENFGASLGISAPEIAPLAFSSKSPAVLGSRCTVFMNSSIVTEQRNGKGPADIMAGLCRSIIENVFTKVIRISNLDSLGQRIVVQGGTFRNDAVLRAMEQYVGRPVVRPPYPEMMGAIGAALIAKERAKEGPSSFIGLEALDGFSYTQDANMPCSFCGNHCKRTVIRFSNGTSWVTNNRCERGEILGEAGEETVRKQLLEQAEKKKKIPNLFRERKRLLFEEEKEEGRPEKKRDLTIGIPMVLSFWDSLPFWRAFFKNLGFSVTVSDSSTRKMYESGLAAVPSDTVCFPAKLVHGHIRNLAKKKVDRIFMPSITAVETENQERTSLSMCAVVKGYPIVMKNSDDPMTRFGIPLEAPLFHWYGKEDRKRQLSAYMKEAFQVSEQETAAAIEAGDKAQARFRRRMREEGEKVLDQVTKEGTYAVVLASRPYQNDSLVNHDLPELFNSFGIPVLTVDSLPCGEVELGKSRLDVVNNYHGRMLASAILAAENPNLEYVQLVSFGCGHDAYLSDEIIRLMKEISGKTPLILKVDESDIQGPLRIRVRSFLETLSGMRKKEGENPREIRELSDPYPVKFTKEDRKEKVVLVPNTSHGFCRIMSAAMKKQGLRAEPLEIGREEAIGLGKKYVHNDICFPAQIVIGEILGALKSGRYPKGSVAVGMGKYIGDCRLTHYSSLLRKALDDAGFPEVPILTNDGDDSHDLHPGYRMDLACAARIAFALPMIDVLEELVRKIRPYETVAGAADKAFEAAMDDVVHGLETRGIWGAKAGFEKAVERMKKVPYDRSARKPRVLIVGEYLLNFHPGANHDVEAYLESNGLEVIEARMTDVIQKSYFYRDSQAREYHVQFPLMEKAWYRLTDQIFDWAHDLTDSIARRHPLYERAARIQEIAKESDSVVHHTFDAGEGILIPGEILHHGSRGCRAFIILQPFGCLPNHVVGRGIVKRLKEVYPDAQILPLDYDPDMSFANIENRLQMLIMNLKEKEGKETLAAEAAVQRSSDFGEEGSPKEEPKKDQKEKKKDGGFRGGNFGGGTRGRAAYT